MMQGLRTKVSALIKPQPEGQRLKKEKKSKKSLRERLRISHPVRNVHVPIEYPDQDGSWGFNDFLNNHNTSSRNHSPRNPKISRSDRGPQGHNMSSSDALPSPNPSVNNYPHRLSPFPLRVTNGEASPESSTENLQNRRRTPPETSADNGFWNNVSDLNPLGSNRFSEYHQQNAELSHEGHNHSRWASDMQEHEYSASDAGNEAQLEYEREIRAARVSRLRDALLNVNPLSNEDVPAGGIPTRYGTGSRYHQYSRPETFAVPSRAGEHHYTESVSIARHRACSTRLHASRPRWLANGAGRRRGHPH